jgi:hypothetical protein
MKIYKVASSNITLFSGAILLSSKYSYRNVYTWSNILQNNYGDAPSPYFNPILALKLIFSYPSIDTIPLLPTYMLRITWIICIGTCNFSAMSSHKVYLSTLSYALFRSTNISPSGDLVLTLYYTSYYMIKAYSTVVWCFRNPAYVGARKLFSSATLVRR